MTKFVEDKDYALWAMVQLTRQLMSAARGAELSAYGISNIEASVLFVVQAIDRSHRRATPAEISRWLFRKPNSVTELLNRMIRKGLVQKVDDAKRKNTKAIVLTAKGQEIYDQSSGRVAIHHIMSCLSPQERRQLWSLLEKLQNQSLSELGINREAPWPNHR